MPDTQHLTPKLTTFIIITGVPFQCVDATTWFYESRSHVGQAGLELLRILLLPPSAKVIDVYPPPHLATVLMVSQVLMMDFTMREAEPLLMSLFCT